MSRILATAAVFAVLAAPAAARSHSGAPTPWAQAEIKVVVAHGLMAKSVQTFHPNDPLTRGALTALVSGLTAEPATASTHSQAPVTIAQLDATLVRGLGLNVAAGEFAAAARDAGLAPPSRFGTEVVARLLGLRTNHPTQLDSLELLPSQPATRAEAAYSAAQILRFGGWETQRIEQLAQTFELPALSPWQGQILKTAVRFIGYPYVWGGESESKESPFGVQAHGGFDCSGFVWRVYKLQTYANEGKLADVLVGRRTSAMSGDVPALER